MQVAFFARVQEVAYPLDQLRQFAAQARKAAGEYVDQERGATAARPRPGHC